ncbi:MAG: FKBP-type peptidyl-prolyl cis-trans isomerase [Prevotella sp.]|nr:FKBP-type peptidyl-prolyl cis-trans isomerase [Prevotella sp.]
MKKVLFAACAFVVAAAFTSCGNGTPKANLKDDVDTLSYAIGMAQSEGLKQYLVDRMGVDTAYIDDFIKGLNDAATAGDDKRKAAYYAGLQIGQQLGGQMLQGINYEVFGNDTTQSVSLKNLIAGFVAGVTEKDQKMTLLQARMTADQKIQEVKAKAMEEQFGKWKKQNEDFLAKNSKAEGVVTLPSGVQYKVITEGKGAVPADTSLVSVNYTGKIIDGTVFDTNMRDENSKPAEFRCNQVIKGWTEILTKMQVGSKWEVYIPQELAYGPRQQGEVIKPFSTLIFTIELLSAK